VGEHPFDLTGKVALVTGANSGLGLGWATAIARAGGDVIIWGRRAGANERAAESVRTFGTRVLAQQVDVSDEQRVERAAVEAVEQLGRLDGAVVNAGFNNHPPSFLDLTTSAWHELLATNLHGAYYTLRESIRHMTAREGGGSIVVCGSLTVTDGVPKIAHYAAAKGALASVTRSLAVEYGAQGIRVNMVLPGRIVTDLGETSPDEKAAMEDRAHVIPIPRMGTPEDCAGIVVYLLSDAASYHTGDLITVDGGLAVRLP
jgi:NAD(P)-dependent dehydrogenase (short-subunit alcohol dehydrogenase family)